ncbi:MAG: Signal transduction histidine kinase, partial [Daejeonella sp.]|nr:Signal transduction histidine kinase [Daejeonella sp.]
ILYNLAEGFLPDPQFNIPEKLQNFLGYGFGYLFAAYCPYYFYKTMGIAKLKLHGTWGTLLVLLPVIVFYGIYYPLTDDLEGTRKNVYYIPGLYAVIVYWVTFREIFKEYRLTKNRTLMYERVCIYLAVFPVCVTPILGGFLGVEKWIVTTIFNVGFLVVNGIFMRQMVRRSKEEYHELQDLNASLSQRVSERTEELEKLNEQQTYNFINLVHETKTPLTLINNYLNDYIKKRDKEEELLLIKAGVDKLTKDITSLFDLERFNKGISVYKHNQISNFSQILKDTISLFKNCYQREPLFWSETIEEDILINADPSAVNRLINNLIENAIKYSKAKGLIEIELIKENSKIIFSIRDEGEGIKPEFHKKIFEPYFQIGHQKESKQGMGLGLPIVKKVVDSLGGEITVKSNPEIQPGTVFTLSFDAVEAELSTVNHYQCTALDTESQLSYRNNFIDVPHEHEKSSIFIVEDNLEMLKYLMEKLKTSYNVYFAFNGAEALYRLPQLPSVPDLIISDVMMDDLDGFGFATELSRQSSYNHVPIIFLSAKSTLEDRITGLKLGAIDFISKPFSYDELILKVEAVLDTIASQRQAIINLTLSGLKNLKISSPDSLHLIYDKCRQFNLTTRESQIVVCIRDGVSSNKDLANKLNIAERTITTHIQNIYHKMEVSNRLDLIKKLDG